VHVITDAWLAKSRAIYLWRPPACCCYRWSCGFDIDACGGWLVSLGFLKGAREGWPIVGSLVNWSSKNEAEQRDRFVRSDVMAKRWVRYWAKMSITQALGERVSAGLAGVNSGGLEKLLAVAPDCLGMRCPCRVAGR
jgi:hypothetical protein